MIRVQRWTVHRNGIDGEPFFSILFTDSDEPDAGLMHASLFKRKGHCAIHSVGRLAEEKIEMVENGWRGDKYEKKLRAFFKDGGVEWS